MSFVNSIPEARVYQHPVGEMPHGSAVEETRSTSGIGGTSELIVSNPKRGSYGTAPQRLEVAPCAG